MGYTPPVMYAIQGYSATLNPVDSDVYYFGSLYEAAASTARNYARIYIPIQGVIRTCFVQMSSSVIGTNESIVLAIRLNDTTDYPVSSVAAATEFRLFTNESLQIPVKVGDYIEFKLTCPLWVTNPEGCRFRCVAGISTC